jgi:hypothetical protein
MCQDVSAGFEILEFENGRAEDLAKRGDRTNRA